MNRITNETEAQQALAELGAWLEMYRGVIRRDQMYSHGEDESAVFARAACHQILSKSTANGLGGCRLCRS